MPAQTQQAQFVLMTRQARQPPMPTHSWPWRAAARGHCSRAALSSLARAGAVRDARGEDDTLTTCGLGRARLRCGQWRLRSLAQSRDVVRWRAQALPNVLAAMTAP
jgi:hypothetical protein